MDPNARETQPVPLPENSEYPTDPAVPPVPNTDHRYLIASTDALWRAISPLSMSSLQKLICDPPALRYEGTLYGYLNSILSFIAPSSVGFQIGFQHTLRPPSSGLSYTPHRRVGSDGLEHDVRVPGAGRELGVRYPDISLSKVIPHSADRILRTFAILEIKISYIGDGSDEIARFPEDPRIFELFSQASGYFLRVNKQRNALYQEGSYVPVFVIFGKFYSEIVAVYDETEGAWIPQRFKPWLHIFEVHTGGRRPLFHVLAEQALSKSPLSLRAFVVPTVPPYRSVAVPTVPVAPAAIPPVAQLPLPSRIPPISTDPVPFLRIQKQCLVGAGFPASPGNVFRWMGLAWMGLACSQDALGRCSHTGMHACRCDTGTSADSEIDVPSFLSAVREAVGVYARAGV
ncbi:hypothetical protein GGX14DRAFT_694650 [Mycena pura]|uniref:Uncharacterized protein n=1 Tax=Mycena pura TaxID=153505 RepID=A0AAD6VVH6_9AGAR|nr:hypothetical protein GGX14DRAFT_694650 [Mycena pura]